MSEKKCRNCRYNEDGCCCYWDYSQVRDTDCCAHFMKRPETTPEWIKEYDSYMKDYTKRLLENLQSIKEYDNSVSKRVNKNESEERVCRAYPEKETFKVRVFAMSGSVIEIEGVSAIRRQPEREPTEFYFLDKNGNGIALFNKNNIVGYQIIEK